MADIEGLSVLRIFRLVSVTSSYLHLFILHRASFLSPYLPPSRHLSLCIPVSPSPHPCVSFLCFVQLRVFRLARWWHGFLVFLQMTLKYSFLLLIVFLGFVIIGYQLFHKEYNPHVCQISTDCDPRWHMGSVYRSFLFIFTIFSGLWSERLWDCMEVSGPALCLTFFLSAIIIGNLLVDPVLICINAWFLCYYKSLGNNTYAVNCIKMYQISSF